MTPDSETSEKTQSRWPGLVLSLLVPGFGLLRGRQFRRGMAWILALELGGVIIVFLLALEFIPIAIALSASAIWLFAFLWMLRASFCRGRMTPRLWALFFSLLILFTFMPVPVTEFKISTGAMEPTLRGAGDGNTPDHVVVDRFSYLFSKPKRGDLVVFETSSIDGISHYLDAGEIYFVKRLIGLPGEKIEIKDGSVFADGRRLGESDGIPPIEYTNYNRKKDDVYIISDSEYFVLGDNSPKSADSRLWGYVPESAIIGKVTKIYFPFARMGTPRFKPTDREQD